MARPKKHKELLRCHQLNIALNTLELEKVTKDAKAMGMDIVSFSRKSLMTKRALKAGIHPMAKQLLVELSRQGTNLNQIARKTNSNLNTDTDLKIQLQRTQRVLDSIKILLLDDSKTN